MAETMSQAEWEAKRRAHLDRRAAKKRAAWKKRPHTVYEVAFEDGYRYIGVTHHTIADRLRAHKRDYSVVGRRLDLGYQYEVREIAKYPDRAEAEDREAREIKAVPKQDLLNLLTPLEDWEKNERGKDDSAVT